MHQIVIRARANDKLRRAPARRGQVAWSAVLGALVILLGAGFGYRVLHHHLERAPRRTPIPPGTLNQLPLEIGPWVGRDEPVDDAIVRTADVDDYVSRHYVRTTDNQAVGLWIAYGVRARDLMPHRPEVCYTGAGWTLQDRDTLTVPLSDGTPLQAGVLTFAPSGLGTRPLTVLNYYIVDGQTCADVSLLRSKAWRGQASIRYMVQVQITCQQTPAGGTAAPVDVAREFAAVLHGQIRELLNRTVGSAAPAMAARQSGATVAQSTEGYLIGPMGELAPEPRP